jgi:hypothetical protein
MLLNILKMELSLRVADMKILVLRLVHHHHLHWSLIRV